MPTVAELRARSGPKPLPKATHTVTLVEGQHLLAESQRLNEELVDVLVQAQRATEDGEEQQGPRRKMAEAAIPPRATEIKAEQAALGERLAEFQGEVGLVGMTGGEWHRWKEANPPREDSRADLVLAKGWCDSSALFEALGRFVKTWNGEELADGDWDGWLAESIHYPDRRDLVAAVVDMHEEGVARAPKSSTASSTTESSATD